MVDDRTRLLILGSLPGEMSLARAEYYANPRNQFWRLIAAAAGQALPEAYEARLARLRDFGVGLWDVVGSAERVGSLDGAIRHATPNRLADLVATLPDLRAVAFNGGRAHALGAPVLAGREGIVLLPLPSSSPAYTLAFDLKLARWRSIAPYVVAPGDGA
ncbi:DNA-deoxyinosine glycosylase [Phenylobacterium sp.]|uniref:DNA-deoxyinosine glycosylase n=1 Tax=Phenylobacterium sp. TaxID=1871053 RepID=UPI0027321D43|nr:DNA-deoxyinosine glycosylase [Phenylobacterium sp.]MDP1875223.1 DNA-deoxyinosine glycosylase [Phenylobacterium sp.]